LIQITPQLRILVAIDAVDGRKYAPSIVIRSFFRRRAAGQALWGWKHCARVLNSA
jgi:hypothetical protein